MKYWKNGITIISFLLLGCSFFVLSAQTRAVSAQPDNQQSTSIPTATPIIPTVTGTPRGTYVKVNGENDQINVRECPNATTCSKVGVLLAGQEVPAKGKTKAGEWIEIEYPGVPGGLAWVHSSLVSLYGGNLEIVEPPATPTPLVTSTINPTLAAQFIVTIQPSRLPTYTQPAPLAIPTFQPVDDQRSIGNVPMGMLILGLAALGLFGSLLSMLQGR
jgi:hypothetical protein